MTSDEERIERLLRRADPGPALPPGGEARIKAAVHPVWRQLVRRRIARRMTIVALAAAAILLLVLLPLASRTPPAPVLPVPVGRVEIVRGPVDDSFRQPGLVAGVRLHTAPASRAALRMIQGTSLRLDSDTTIRLVSSRLVELERGAIYIDSNGAHSAPMEVRTPMGNVRDIGTRFEIRLDDHLLVRVREGNVHIATQAHQFRLSAGQESTIAPDGSLETVALAPDHASWTAAVAPPFSIEGRSVAALLNWCARESGLAVRYHDAVAERTAHTTLLHGAANDFQPLEAVETILPTAGLEAVPGRGELVIRVRSPLR
ncbi:MAG: FecR family protein [Acidobacteriota bacterium]